MNKLGILLLLLGVCFQTLLAQKSHDIQEAIVPNMEVIDGVVYDSGRIAKRVTAIPTVFINQPLVIIDGVDYDSLRIAKSKTGDPLASINPKEIKSINVLQCDSAVLVYGDKGKNGAIIVTMEKSKWRKTKIH